MNKDDKVFLRHILESIGYIEEDTYQINEESFLKNRQIQDVVVRRFEIIGEAANNISKETKKNFSDVAWSDIIGMRNNLIHEYFGIDLETVWDSVQNDLPKLKEQVVRMLEK